MLQTSIVPPLKPAEPDAPLSGLTLAMRVALLALHTSSVAGAPPVVFWPQRRVYQRASIAAGDGAPGSGIGPEIQPSTMAGLCRRNLAECMQHRSCPRLTVAKLTSNGAWYARTIERAALQRLRQVTGVA